MNLAQPTKTALSLYITREPITADFSRTQTYVIIRQTHFSRSGGCSHSCLNPRDRRLCQDLQDSLQLSSFRAYKRSLELLVQLNSKIASYCTKTWTLQVLQKSKNLQCLPMTSCFDVNFVLVFCFAILGTNRVAEYTRFLRHRCDFEPWSMSKIFHIS